MAYNPLPHLFLKKSKAAFRTIIDLIPVNSATNSKSWPMPHMESEVHDFKRNCCFTGIDFVSGYCQLPLNHLSYDACGAVCPPGALRLTGVLHGLNNSVAHFQFHVEPLFSELLNNINLWVKALVILLSIHDMKSLFYSSLKY